MLTKEQLIERRTGIGASEIGAVLGLSRYASPVDVYMRKVGQADEEESGLHASLGNELEDWIARQYVEATGLRVQASPATLRHPAIPWMFAHLDRVVLGHRRVLECKFTTLGERWGRPTNGPIQDAAEAAELMPMEHVAQVTQEMLCAGFQEADVAVAIVDRKIDFRVFSLRLDRIFADALIAGGDAFWHNHVVPQTPPPPTSISDIAALYPSDNGAVVHATDEIETVVEMYRGAREGRKGAEEVEQAYALQLKAYMGGAQILKSIEGRVLATHKSRSRRAVDVSRLKAELPEIAIEYMSETQFRTLLLVK